MICYTVIGYMYLCKRWVWPGEEDVLFDHVVFASTGTSAQASPRGWRKTYLDLLLISYNNILKKKDANMQVKLISFYFLEKEKKDIEFSIPGYLVCFSRHDDFMYMPNLNFESISTKYIWEFQSQLGNLEHYWKI